MLVFLSYAYSDTPVADVIRAGLESCGFDVWSDEAARPGTSLAERITSGLNAADALVVILGKDTATRQWTSLEIGGALASGKPIVPVLIDKDAAIPSLLTDWQYLDLSDPDLRERRLTVLCEAVRAAPSTSRAGKSRSELIEGASEALRKETHAYMDAAVARERTVRWLQLMVTTLSVVAAATALVVASSNASAVFASIAAGLGAVLASLIGFYFGARNAPKGPSGHPKDRQ